MTAVVVGSGDVVVVGFHRWLLSWFWFIWIYPRHNRRVRLRKGKLEIQSISTWSACIGECLPRARACISSRCIFFYCWITIWKVWNKSLEQSRIGRTTIRLDLTLEWNLDRLIYWYQKAYDIDNIGAKQTCTVMVVNIVALPSFFKSSKFEIIH